MPLPLGARGIMFSGCPSVRSKPEIPSFDLYIGPLVHPTNRDSFTACPSVRLSVYLSVCPSGEVFRHLPETAWREWPEILHADVSWPPPELISLWPGLLIFLILALFWLCGTGQIWGFRAFPGQRMEEWQLILHADGSSPPPELISLWPRSIDFSNFGTILT